MLSGERIAQDGSARFKYSLVFQQRPRLDLQAGSYARNVIDGDISLRALNGAQIGPIDTALVRQCLLAEPARGAKLAHVLRQNVSQGAFVRPFHEHNPADCLL
jgi:hypothetical protein